MPFLPLSSGGGASLDDAERTVISVSAPRSEQHGNDDVSRFLPTKSRSFAWFTELSVVNPTDASTPSSAAPTVARSQSQQLQRCLLLDQRSQHASALSVGLAEGTPAETLEATRRQLWRRLQLPLSLQGTAIDHGNQIDESHRPTRCTNDRGSGDKTAKSTAFVLVSASKSRRRRFSLDSCSSTGRRCRRLDQRRSTAPLPHQVVLTLRLARPSTITTDASIEDARSPRVLRHLCALNSPSKKHWTPAERLCCEVRATEEDYVDDLRRLIEGFFAPLAGRAAAADIPLGPLSELHFAARFLLRVHEELLAQMSVRVVAGGGESPRSGNASVPINDGTVSSQGEYGDHGDSDVDTDDGEDELDDEDDVTHPNQTSHEPIGARRDPPVSANQIARAFLCTAQYMKAYALYCAAHRPATDELNALHKKHPRVFFDAEVSMASPLAESAALTFPEVLSELIKPVQRICRYPMLLRSLVDQSSPSSPSIVTENATDDSKLLREALDAIENVSDLVNARVRDAQNNARLLELFATLPVSGKRRAAAAKVRLLRPARAFVCEACAAVSVTRVAPRWRWLRKWSSLLLRLHVPRCFRSQPIEIEAVGPRDSDLRERLAQCGRCEHVSCLPPSPCSSGDCHEGASGVTAACGGRGEQSRLILLSDVLLMAKKCAHKLQVRRQICLSCAAVSEVDPSTSDDHNEAALLLVAAKVGRCHCHQLTPATLQRPLLVKRNSSESVSLAGSASDLLSPSVVTNIGAAVGSSNVSDTKWRRSPPLLLPLRASRRYLLRFDSARAKSEFAAQLRDAIAKSTRVEPPPPIPRPSRSSKRPSKRMAARRLWRSLTHPELAAATAAVASSTRATAPDAAASTSVDRQSRSMGGRRARRHASLAAAISSRGGVDMSVASSVDSVDADAALVDSLDDLGDFV